MTALNNLNKNMPILIVDDYSTVRRIVKNCLAKLGFKNVIEAENGQSALDKIKDNEFELIISDWSMPDMLGTELVNAVRAHKALRSIPFLMVIAETQKREMRRGADPEKSEFIVKPFTTDVLQEKMQRLFADNTV